MCGMTALSNILVASAIIVLFLLSAVLIIQLISLSANIIGTADIIDTYNLVWYAFIDLDVWCNGHHLSIPAISIGPHQDIII
jgi:hypothetical protein